LSPEDGTKIRCPNIEVGAFRASLTFFDDMTAKCGNCKKALVSVHPFELTKAGFPRRVGANDLPVLP
jgi:hypothetical protein